jgi:glycosyltransferase involved in cell wall biosynthesis
VISIVIPANNEERLLPGCLLAVLASDDPGGAIEVIVVANGCTDATATVARALADDFAARGWALRVIERTTGGKMAALNAADKAAKYPARAYLDADVLLDPPLLQQLCQTLDTSLPVYSSGHVKIAAPDNRFSRAYAAFYRQVPYFTHGVPGCGLFAVNAAGRQRWGDFPDIIADDIFVRLQFAPTERILLKAGYDWPIVEGFQNLVRVRRRQNAGVAQVALRYPELARNDDKAPMTFWRLFTLILRHPVGFVAYAAVALAVKLGNKNGTNTWVRGR